MARMMGTSGRIKVTFSLPITLVEELRRMVDAGGAVSQSTLVAEAVAKEVRARRRLLLRDELRAAAADPEFMRDVAEAMRDFALSDDESVIAGP